MNKGWNSKKKWLPTIGLGSLLVLLSFLYLYQDDIKAASDFFILLVCLLVFSPLLLLLTSPPKGGRKEYSHDEFGWKNWQVLEMPTSCAECNDSVEVQKLDWTGPREARCPSCGNRVDVQINPMYKKGDERHTEDGDSIPKVISGFMYIVFGIGLAAALLSADRSSLYFLLGVLVTLVGFIWMASSMRSESPYRDGKYSRQTWQVAEFPIGCPECGHPVEVYKLAWAGDKEVHCPNCSTKIDFATAIVTGPRLKSESR